MAELLKRGVVAALAPRNAPSFDILAAKGKRTVRIRVKTKSSEYSDWQWMAKTDGAIFPDLSDRDDFVILVDLARETKDTSFYVVPTLVLNALLKDIYHTWLKTPGKHGQPHNPTRKRNLNQKAYADKLAEYADRWEVLWEEQPSRPHERT